MGAFWGKATVLNPLNAGSIPNMRSISGLVNCYGVRDKLLLSD